MNSRLCLGRAASSKWVQMPALVLSLVLSLAVQSFAEAPYLAANVPDGVVLLPPPPAEGTPEGLADLEEVRATVRGRTAVEKDKATMDSSLKFSLFGPAIGPVFELSELPKTAALLEEVKKEIGQTIDTPKDHFKRRRPYQLDESLSLGKPEPSFGYPSGHSTRGTVYALVLAELFPQRRKQVLEIGRNIGWDRVIIGKHFPSDIYAGRVLGYAIVRELMESPGFRTDLAEAKKEVLAAEAAVTGKRIKQNAAGERPEAVAKP